MTVSGLSINNFQLQYQLLKPENGADAFASRQDIAAKPAIAAATAAHASKAAGPAEPETEQQKAFLDQLMEQMLANRIGLDKQKYDEIQQKIEETEAEKDALAQQPASVERDNKLSVLDDKLTQLNKALEALIEQANRNRERKERSEQAAKDVIAQYRNAAFVKQEPTIFL